MIKLKNPLNYQGVIYNEGDTVTLPLEFEKKLLENGTAEQIVANEITEGEIKESKKRKAKGNDNV